MKLDHTDAVIASAAGITSVIPFLEDMLSRLLTGVLTALISAVALHFIKKIWKTKDESKP